ncbi:MAG: MgtC/SapB family protein [Andreesenia angusta]|nr:MgtC/SapB family protein [Andreesenia angusta]
MESPFDLLSLTPKEIIIRLFAAIIAGGLIGYEREKKGHEAGLRTHILVVVGSCLFSIIQIKIALTAISMVKASEESALVIRTDLTRIVAQVVSGVGFLGAGTIIISKKRVRGLTTAASIWTTAALGVGFGMGYFFTMTLSTIMVLITLTVSKKLFRAPDPINFEVAYINQPELSKEIRNFFKDKKVTLLADHYYYVMKEETIYHRNHYTIDASLLESKSEFFDELFHLGEIDEIKSLYILK